MLMETWLNEAWREGGREDGRSGQVESTPIIQDTVTLVRLPAHIAKIVALQVTIKTGCRKL